jgi:tRNA-dihydrouridine synthase
VALHARTAEQHYSGRADWSAIAELKQAVATVPVLGNGDIWEPADALAMLDATGCDGVVVGRGCLGRPWLFRDLTDAFAGRAVGPPPTLGEVLDVMATHAQLLVDDLGEPGGVLSFRRHVAWYLIGLPVGKAARVALVAATSVGDVDRALDGLRRSVDLSFRPRPEVASAPRGHTNGPKRVVVPEGWFDAVDDPTPPRGADLLISGG